MPFCIAPPAAPLLCFGFCWQSHPCHGEPVSGDGLFLEVARSGGQEYLLLLVDVMGHGTPAAAVVAHLGTMLLTDPRCWDLRPAGLLTLLNAWLAPVWDESGIYVTAQAFLLLRDGTVIGSNAAIPNPRQRTATPASVVWNLPGGTMLGPVTPQAWTEDMLTLALGEGLLAYTDGVSEAGTPQFGLALLDAFLVADTLGPGLVGRLIGALQQHAPIDWPGDDTTAFWLERTVPSDGAALNEELQFVVQ